MAAACIGRLLWIMTRCSNRLQKVQSGGAHASSSTDIHKNLHDGFMSPNDADALQGIGERMLEGPKCGLKQYFVTATVSVPVSLGAKPAQAEGVCCIVHRLDTVALLHICFLVLGLVVCTRSPFQNIHVASSCATK